jgi:hypothetical protein
MRSDVDPAVIERAVVKAIYATFDRTKWMELGLETGALEYIRNHPRLLRSLSWGDDDYLSCVVEAVPVMLGERSARNGPRFGRRFPELAAVEKFLDLPAWLRKHEPALYQSLYGDDDTVLDELQVVADELGIDDVDEHAARIRRSLIDDPAQAIGSSKELLETVLKAVLGLHGTGPETRLDVPELVHRAGVQLGLHPAGHRGTEPGAEQRRKLLGALVTVVNSAAELRNAGFGTGHGVSQRRPLDAATARMVVASAVAAAAFYLEAYAAEQDS